MARKRVWFAVGAGALLIGVAAGCCVLAGVLGDPVESSPPVPQPALPEAPATDEEPPNEPAGSLPSPPMAHLAHEVPRLLEELSSIEALSSLEPGTPAAQRFLSGLAACVAEGGIPRELSQHLQREGLRDAVIKSCLIASRTGELPETVLTLAQRHIEAARAQPHLGTWSPADPLHDYAALAVFLHSDDPSYLRELIAVRETRGWTNFAAQRSRNPPWIAWLALPGAAYERLLGLAGLEEEEHRHWCEAQGLQQLTAIDPETGVERRACGCAVGEPVSWEALRTQYPLTVPGGCLRCERVRDRGRPVEAVFLEHRGTRYGINGAGSSRYTDPGSIWAEDPDVPDAHIDMGPLIGRGLASCR